MLVVLVSPVYPCHKGHDNVIHVPLNEPGEYVMFPSNTYHRGYYNSTIQKTFFTAQLFAEYKSSDDIHVSRNDNSQFYQLKHVLPCKLTALSNETESGPRDHGQRLVLSRRIQ